MRQSGSGALTAGETRRTAMERRVAVRPALTAYKKRRDGVTVASTGPLDAARNRGEEGTPAEKTISVLEAGYREPRAERRNPLLYPNHRIHDCLGIAYGINSSLPVVIVNPHVREPRLEGDVQVLSISISHGKLPFR